MRNHVFGLAVAAVVGHAAAADACAPAPPVGEAVRIADEEALIAWDGATKTEHFVRRASFRSSSASFGFIVPTPTKPELGEIEAALFDELAAKLTPELVFEETGYEVSAGCALFYAAKGMSRGVEAAAPAVRVLEEREVAGFDAAVLSADDPEALAAWLKERGFASGASLTDWLAPYVANHWVLTAFKIASHDETARTHAVGTTAVRMSFSTDRPFYPYREPSDQRETVVAAHQDVAVDHRMLRVYFASDGKYEGALGNGGVFPGETKLAAWIPTPSSARTLLPERTFLTVFEDGSNPRPGTDDVYFAPARDQSPVAIPPLVIQQPRHVVIPLELVFLTVLGAAAAGFFFRRARKKLRA